MSGKKSRTKGRRGETAAKRILQDRDYTILADTTAGIATDDLLAQDSSGAIWSVEVKYRKTIEPTRFAGQARFQVRNKKLRWMVLAHIEGTSGWLVLRQAMPPTVWLQKEEQGA